MMQLILENDIYRFTDYLQTNLPQDAWPIIEQQIQSYVLETPNPLNNSKNLQYVGFHFDNAKAVEKYYEKVYLPYQVEKINTPPRGNLSSTNAIIILGIKPGSWQAHLSPVESSWIFGPSSKMLHRLLRIFDIYPYFTNVYKSYYDESNMQLKSIYNELVVIAAIYGLCYNKTDLSVVCLGSYKEYVSLADRFKNDTTLKKLNFKLNFYRIWHPAFLLRAFTEENFKK